MLIVNQATSSEVVLFSAYRKLKEKGAKPRVYSGQKVKIAILCQLPIK